MILVTGATGTIGSSLVPAVLGRGAVVRVLARDVDKTRAAHPEGVEIVRGDLRDLGAVRAALDGVGAVFVNSPSLAGFVDLQQPLIDAAAASSDVHVVRLSVLGAAPDSPMSYGRGHHALDEHLKAVSSNWTILQPNAFLQNLLSSAETIKAGAIYACAGDGAMGMIDTRDIAEVAAAVLTEDGHQGREYALTGPAAITYADAAAALAAELGHDVAYVDVPPEVTRQNLAGFGLPADQIEDVLALFSVIRAGYASAVTPTVEQVLGRPARSVATFAHDYRAAFGG